MPPQVRQVHLPTARGGLGIPSLALHAPLAYVAAWAHVAPALGSTFAATGAAALPAAVSFAPPPAPAYPFQEALEGARATLPHTIASSLPPFTELALGGGVPRPLAPLADALNTHAFEGLLATLPTAEGKARLLSAGGPGAGAWLHAIPIHPATSLADAHFRSALCLRLDLVHPHLTGRPLCSCGSPLGPNASMHLLRCATGGAPSSVHNALRDCVADLAREAGFVTTVEPVGLLPLRPHDTIGRRPDLLCIDPVVGSHLLLDVTVVDPLQRSTLSAAAVKGGAAAAAKVRDKRRHYADHHAGDVVLPLAVEVFGAWDLGFDKF